jgi:hypothetical protein
MKREAVYSSETLVNFYWIIQFYILKHTTLQISFSSRRYFPIYLLQILSILCCSLGAEMSLTSSLHKASSKPFVAKPHDMNRHISLSMYFSKYLRPRIQEEEEYLCNM